MRESKGIKKNGFPGLDCRRRAAVYIRLLDNDQSNYWSVLSRCAWSRGYVISDMYFDDCRSTSSGSTSDFYRLVKDAIRGMFKAVFVYELRRFSREPRHLLTITDGLLRRGIDIISIGDRIDTTAGIESARFDLVRAICSVEEKEQFSKYLAQKRKSQLPIGKSRGRPRICLDRDEILDMRRKGKSLRDIARIVGWRIGQTIELFPIPPSMNSSSSPVKRLAHSTIWPPGRKISAA